jgi:UDP-N-acetylmuramoyl-tripeptide--D-alanyl-D-alanine ligase
MVDVKDLLLSSRSIAHLVDAKLIGDDLSVTDVQIDSRVCGTNSLFVPLKGERTDGHLFIENAVAAGSSLCFVHRDYYLEHEAFFAKSIAHHRVSFLVLDDPLSALQKLASAHLHNFPGLIVIGITGSSGKTTTKELLGSILSEYEHTAVSPGNLNSEIGLPLSALRIREGHRYAVFEMGMNSPGEMDVLVDIAKPRHAAITNIGTAHIGLLGSKEAIAGEKRKIFAHVGQSGRGFLPEDDEYKGFLAEACAGPVEYFGPDSTPGFEGFRDGGLEGIEMRWKGRLVRFPLIGRYNLKNALCAVSMALSLGVPDDEIALGLTKVRPLFGRGEVLTGTVTVIRDCYNANTESMIEAMDFVGSLRWTGRKILILGSMKELGTETEGEHRHIGRYAAGSDVDAVFFYGEESAASYHDALIVKSERGDGKRIEWAAEFSDLEDQVHGYVQPGDLLLLKGSRGVELERLTTGLIGGD